MNESLNPFREFARWAFRHALEMDDESTVKKMIELEMVEVIKRHAPCGDNCMCGEFADAEDWKHGVNCYEETSLLNDDDDDEELRTHPRESLEYADSDGDVLWYEVEHNQVVTPPMYIGTKRQMAKHYTESELEELFWTPLPRLYRKTPLPAPVAQKENQ